MGTEGGINIAVGIENIFEESFRSALGNAVQLGGDGAAFRTEAVAGSAMLDEEPGAGLQIGRASCRERV